MPENTNTSTVEDNCLIFSLPGFPNPCPAQGSTSITTPDGSLSLTLSEAILTSDPKYNIDSTKGDVNVKAIITKEDIRNKIILYESDDDTAYIPLDSSLVLPETYNGILYEERDTTDSTYKYFKIFLPKVSLLLPRGTYVMRCYANITKQIGVNNLACWELMSKQYFVIKTDPIQPNNSEYLKTAFRRGDTGAIEGLPLEVNS